MRAKLNALNLGGLQIQQFGNPTDVLIRMEEQPGGDKGQQEAIAKVQRALGENVELRSSEVIGPTVSAELISSAIWALTFASVGIFLYIWFRFEWQFSVSAIIALLHDVAMTVCLFSILQLEFDLSIVAALLTLIGYAVNDTVVTFDRVRENLRKYKRMSLGELIDLSVNETLSRTAMTAGAVLITLVALFVLGGPVIRGFALAILFGMLVSTYTSMFVAAPLLYVIGVKREWGTDAPVRNAAAGASRARVTFK
jgi:preprotein translocase SecF subunit